MNKVIKVAVVGNPNVGKSALINAIAGSNIKVGNWTGVTVEKLEAFIQYKDYTIQFVDLPGIYSLSNQSAEEKITVDFLLNEKPDVILNVIDSGNIKRNLYLTVQLIEMEIPMVIALNMWDELKNRNIEIDTQKLSKLVCMPAIPTSAIRNTGIKDILDAIINQYTDRVVSSHCEHFEVSIEEQLSKVEALVELYQPYLLSTYPRRYLLSALLEGSFKGEINQKLKEDVESLRKHVEKLYGKDIKAVMIEERYAVVLNILKQCVYSKPTQEESVNFSLMLDRVLLHKYFGIPIFLFMMWLAFEITFTFSTPFVQWLDGILSNLSLFVRGVLENRDSPDWLVSFVIEGILGGVGFVLVFVPVLFTLYIVISFLEGSGYIARAAFLMDRFMSVFGLSGKSFIPLLLGFGCNVPAVYSSRVIDNTKEKILTVLMIPFMSCGARLTVFAFFVSVFFTNHKGLVIFSLYLIGIVMAMFVAILINRFYLRLGSSYFILELPPYRMPTLRYIFSMSWLRVKSFILEAGTFIFATSVVIWFLTNIPFGVKKEDSLLGRFSKEVAVLFEPLGFGTWQATTSLFAGFVAKEVVLSTMGNVYIAETLDENQTPISFSEFIKESVYGFFNSFVLLAEEVATKFGFISKDEEEQNNESLSKIIKSEFTPASAYSFLVFLLLYTPCLATLFAIRQELGSTKWMVMSVFVNFITAYAVSFVVYRLLLHVYS